MCVGTGRKILQPISLQLCSALPERDHVVDDTVQTVVTLSPSLLPSESKCTTRSSGTAHGLVITLMSILPSMGRGRAFLIELVHDFFLRLHRCLHILCAADLSSHSDGKCALISLLRSLVVPTSTGNVQHLPDKLLSSVQTDRCVCRDAQELSTLIHGAECVSIKGSRHLVLIPCSELICLCFGAHRSLSTRANGWSLSRSQLQDSLHSSHSQN